MVEVGLDGRTGGVALVVGYLLVLGLVFANPADGLGAITASTGPLVYVVVLPVAGLAVGAYVVYGGPLAGLLLFLAGNYLALFGVTLMLGLVPVPTAVSAVGVVMFAGATVALVVSVKALVDFVRVVPDLDVDDGAGPEEN